MFLADPIIHTVRVTIFDNPLLNFAFLFLVGASISALWKWAKRNVL